MARNPLCSSSSVLLAIKSLQSLSHCEFVAANAKQEGPNSHPWRNSLLWRVSFNLSVKNNTWIKTYGLGIHTSEVKESPALGDNLQPQHDCLSGPWFLWFCFCGVFFVCSFVDFYLTIHAMVLKGSPQSHWRKDCLTGHCNIKKDLEENPPVW